MYVLTTTDGYAGPLSYSAGQVLQIPHDFYHPASMTRLGATLTCPQQAALVLWKTVQPDWPFPIND
jgi:hypothetical protein